MRLSILVPAAIVIGAVSGIAAAFYEYGGFSRGSQVTKAAAPADGPHPVAVVEEPKHNFGSMELNATKSHDFTIQNKGEATLQLTKGKPTCKCTEFRLEETTVPPGGSVTVGLEWKGEGEIGPFRQTAPLLTNDPQRPTIELTVEGELTEAVIIDPAELVFSSLPSREPVSGKVQIYALHSDNLEVLSHQFESEKGSEQFDVAIEPLPADQLDSRKAKSGVLVKVTSKPILPLGPIRQKITLETNLVHRSKLEFSVTGTVVSDISIIGPDFSQANNVLRLGLVKSGAGAERTLRLVTRGPFRKEIKFTVASKNPEFLEVTFGEMIEVNQGLVTQTPITIAVPPGSPQANHLGSKLGELGTVVLETNHPDVKEVPIKVHFAVEK